MGLVGWFFAVKRTFVAVTLGGYLCGAIERIA